MKNEVNSDDSSPLSSPPPSDEDEERDEEMQDYETSPNQDSDDIAMVQGLASSPPEMDDDDDGSPLSSAPPSDDDEHRDKERQDSGQAQQSSEVDNTANEHLSPSHPSIDGSHANLDMIDASEAEASIKDEIGDPRLLMPPPAPAPAEERENHVDIALKYLSDPANQHYSTNHNRGVLMSMGLPKDVIDDLVEGFNELEAVTPRPQASSSRAIIGDGQNNLSIDQFRSPRVRDAPPNKRPRLSSPRGSSSAVNKQFPRLQLDRARRDSQSGVPMERILIR